MMSNSENRQGRESYWSINQRRIVKNILTFVVLSATILTAVVVFGRYSPLQAKAHPSRSQSGSLQASTSHQAVFASQLYGGWNSVAIAIPSDQALNLWNVSNNNYQTGGSTLWSPTKFQNPQYDGISHDGKDLLFQTSGSGHTYYSRLVKQMAGTGFFFEENDANAGNAIWFTDNQHVLIATAHTGVMKVDSLNGSSTPFLPSLSGVQLQFYNNGYLYYLNPAATPGALYRINVTTGQQQPVSHLHTSTTYWLSPTGSIVYFANKVGPAGNPGIYAVNSDGSNLRLLRQYADGTPIGFAEDNSLMIMRYEQGKFQVVKLGATLAQDQVVMPDAAPGAVSLCDTMAGGPDLICDNDIALAPYGHAVIVQVTFADGTHKVWDDDLVTGKQFILQVGPATGSLVKLIGWDTVPVNL